MISKKHVFLTFSFLGVFFIVTGFFGIDYLKRDIRKQLAIKLPPLNGSESTAKWVNSSQPSILHIYLYNITNHHDLESGQDSPIKVTEVGPFVYRVKPKVVIEGWSDDQQTIRYRKEQTYVFDAKQSKYPLNINLTVLNVPLVSTITAAIESQKNSIFISTFKMTLNHYIRSHNETLFINRTADEMLFKGYKIPMVEKLLTTASWVITVPIPPNGTFGLFYGKNHTDHGEFNVYTGHNSIERIGLINSWNNLTQNTCFLSDECNRIGGSDGIRYPPQLNYKHNKTLELYSTQFHRVLDLDFTDEVSVNGLKTYRYDLSSRNFESKKANGCYCPDPSKQIGNESICSFGGVQDVSTCERNVPLVLSMPHFVGASPELLQKYQGMEPNSSLHHSYMHIDPLTGMVLAGEKQAQINFLVQKIPGLTGFDKINNMLIPVVWIKQTAFISEKQAEAYYKAVHQKVDWLAYGGCAVLAFGAMLFLIGGIGFLCALNQTESKKVIDETSMYTKNKPIDSKSRYTQKDVKSQDEIRQF